MARKSTASLVFPVGGIDRSSAYQNQLPFTTTDALNSRPRDALEGRLRGGSRPGLTRYDPAPLGGTRVTGTLDATGPVTTSVWTITSTTSIFDQSMAGRDTLTVSGSDYEITEYVSSTEVRVAGDATGATGAITITRSIKALYVPNTALGTHAFGANYGDFTGYNEGDTITPDDSGNVYTIIYNVASSSYKRFIASEPADNDKKLQDMTLTTTGTLSTEATYAGQGNSTVTCLDVADHKFVAGMVGGFIIFDTSGGRYEIVGYTGTTVVTVRGDATDEAGSDTFVVYYDPQSIRMIASVPYTRTVSGSTAQNWEDEFVSIQQGTSEDILSEPWSQAGWSAYRPVGIFGTYVTAPDVTNLAVAIAPSLDIDITSAYTVQLRIVPYAGGLHGDFYIYAGMADADIAEPVIADAGGDFDGVVFKLSFDGTIYGGYVKEYVNGVAVNSQVFQPSSTQTAPLVMTLRFHDTLIRWGGGDTWRGSGTLSATPGGTRWGFGVQQLGIGYPNHALVDRAAVSYNETYTTYSGPARRVAVAIAGGKLYRTDPARPTDFEQVVVTPTLNADQSILAVPHLGKLYIADVGDTIVSGTDGVVSQAGNDRFDSDTFVDWTAVLTDQNKSDYAINITSAFDDTVVGWHKIGTVAVDFLTLSADAGAGSTVCTFYIERAPKVYDPSAGTLAIWTATGTTKVPFGCPLICTYRDRIVMAGAPEAPHVWHMCQQGDPLDWDYTDGSAGTPISATNSDAGQLGSPITALIPHSDDYLIMASLNSLWIMRGDPTFGGTIDNLSNSVGIIGKLAWCRGPAAELIFLSRDGLYILHPGASTYPESLSRDRLPDELRGLSSETHDIQLLYDPTHRGVNIFLVGKEESSNKHWWYDWDTKGFWPSSHATGHDPTASYAYVADTSGASAILLGCRDGYIRYIDRSSPGDDGAAINSYVVYGPMKLGIDEERVGILTALSASLDNDSADVDWAVQVGDTAEEALAATAFANGTWSAGRNNKQLIRARGALYYLRLTARNNEPWAIEWIHTERETRGRVH